MTEPMGALYKKMLRQPLLDKIAEAGQIWRAHLNDCADCRICADDPTAPCACAVCQIADVLDVYQGCQP